MAGELLIIITGFFKWILKGCRTDLREEINGNKSKDDGIRGLNYIIGLIIVLVIILLSIYLF